MGIQFSQLPVTSKVTDSDYVVLVDANENILKRIDANKLNNSVFIGATENADGKSGQVTQPLAGDQSKFLSGDGTWKDIDHASSYVGMIIHSTTFDTEAKVKSFYGGNKWILHSGYFLRGASSGVVANSATKNGGSDTINISHNHQQGDLRAKIGCPSGDPTKICFVSADPTDPNTGARQNCTYGTQTTGYISNVAFAHYTPVVGYTNTKLSSAQSVVPNYKNVYIWERTK